MQNEAASPGSGTETWADAQTRLKALIVRVGTLHQNLVGGHQNLNWRGPSADYFQHQASDQDSYLNRNLEDLYSLLMLATSAEQDARAKKASHASGAAS